MDLLLLSAYLIPLTVIFVYCCLQLSLIFSHFRYKPQKPQALGKDGFPFVTIQLPIYNEKYVVERLLAAVTQMDYPKDRLEIQVLDDSNDETTEILQREVKAYQQKGLQIELIRRESREGFKAGALQNGLGRAKGRFIAIFDADFIPDTSFLLKTIPFFSKPDVGVVQSRWAHLNENYSLLTRLQAFGLDAHFFIEQTGRSAAGHLINFNGTGGVWRKDTILDAGAWSADTLTEDLDLSYRAQLRGWKFIYLRDLESPAELPVSLPAIKSQQYRWMKGGAECFVKNASKVLSSKKLNWGSKLHGFYHLLNSSIFISVFALSLTSVPLVFHTDIFSKYHRLVNFTTLFQVNWLILAAFYWYAFRKKNASFFAFIPRFFTFLTFMLGLSLHNTLAVAEGLMGRKSPFIRTPKFNVVDRQDIWKNNSYSSRKISCVTWLEMGIALLFFAMLFFDYRNGLYGMLPFHFMVFAGYTLVSGYTLAHHIQRQKTGGMKPKSR